MRFIGLLRVKNEARWIANVLRSLSPLCESVLMLDDHSDDDTPQIAAGLGVTVLASPFEGFDESRDKNYLLAEAWKRLSLGDVAVMIDGDEELVRGDDDVIRAQMESGAPALSLRILYLWDNVTLVRTDGVYGRFSRPSVFRLSDPGLMFPDSAFGGNMHCSSVPIQLVPLAIQSPARLLHYGYLNRDDRVRKYAWYNARDPNSVAEDRYRHVVQGDIPEVPADARLMHAGPLKLMPRGMV